MNALHPDFLRVPLAHRGLHDKAAGVIENSPSAFKAAIRAGYGIELDVQVSADGRAMVFHDYDLDRLTGETGPVKSRPAESLAGITLAGSTDAIPTLASVLDMVAGKVPLLIEIKDQSRCLGTTGIGPLEQTVALDLAAYKGPVAVMSFNPHAVASFAALSPGTCRGLTTGDFTPAEYPDTDPARLAQLADIADFGAVGANFISHYVAELDTPAVSRLRAAGCPVLCWTVRSPQQEITARRVAHNITFEGYHAPMAGA